MQDIDHMNPCRGKVPIPILKKSKMFSSVIPLHQNNNIVCPQIQKIKSSRSVANILHAHVDKNEQANSDNNSSQSDRIRRSSKKGSKLIQNNENNPLTSDNDHLNIKDFSKKRSVQTLLGEHNFIQNSHRNAHQASENLHFHSKQQNSDNLQSLIVENSQLATQLSRRQKQLQQQEKQYFAMEQNYIRLLEVTHMRSESQVKILLDSQEQKLNKSKLKESSLSDQVSRLKIRLEGLEISGIGDQHKGDSFKLSDVI